MKINHRISIHATEAIQRELDRLGVVVDEGFVTFIVDEDDARWPQLADFVARHSAVDVVSTKATSGELAAAEWLVMKPAWHAGYPQPEDEYLATTYDLSDYCPQCGMGAVQRAPFRIRGEPKWGDKSIFQLNWVFDEYFARRDAWENTLRPLGIASRPVLDHKSGSTLSGVVQCDFSAISTSELVLGDHPYRCCQRCERRKYLPFTRGCFPPFRRAPSPAPVLKSRESFGDGAKSFRAVVVSRDVYAAISQAKLRGCSFLPMCEDDSAG